MSPEAAKDWPGRLGLENAPAVAIVAGSGWRSVVERLRSIAALPIGEIPGCRPPSIEGHGAELARCATAKGSEVLVATGRVHLYEGCDPEGITTLVRRLADIGVERMVLTNAAGGLDPKLRRGDIVAIEDDLNLTMRLMAAKRSFEKPLYDRGMLETIEKTAREGSLRLSRGTYGAVSGPNFETRAEIAMLRRLGATRSEVATSIFGFADELRWDEEREAFRMGGFTLEYVDLASPERAGVPSLAGPVVP